MFLTTAPRGAVAVDRSPGGSFWFEPMGMRTASGVRVTPMSSMTLPAVYACVQVLAKSFALMPFCLWQGLPGGGRKARKDHWLYRLFCKAPNRFQSPFEWRMMLMGHLALRGNAFCQITEGRGGEIVELLPLHPDRMKIELLPNGSYRYRYTDQQGRELVYMRSEIWHLRWLSDDGIVGLNPMEMAREVIGEGLAMQSFTSRFYLNDGRPGGWIEFDGKFTSDTAKEEWRRSWQKAYSGPNKGRVAVLEKGMKYHELALNLADAQYATARDRNINDIARTFGVAPHKIQHLERSTNNNIEHQSIEFWTDTMTPIGKAWASSAEFQLLGPDTDLDADFDATPLMRGDGKSRADRLRSLVLAGIYTRNEARGEEGKDPIEGGDKLLQPVNTVQLDENGDPEPLPGGASQPKPGGPDNGSGERVQRLLEGNAGRMARRLAAGNAPGPEALAEALAIDTTAAIEWLTTAGNWPAPEEQIAASLMALAKKGTR